MFKVGDKAKIRKSIDDANPIQPKYIGQTGTIIRIDEREAPNITMEWGGGIIESFWPEELTKIK